MITEGGIPAEYQPVEYISSSGAQWLNTGFTPACTDRIEMKLNFNNKTDTQCLWCSRGTSTSTSTFTCFMISGNKLRFDRNTNTAGGNVLSPTAGADQTVVADGYTLKCTLDGNDAGTIHNSRGGVRTAAVSLPCRYLHSPCGVIAESDLNAVCELVWGLAEKAALSQ